MAMDHDYTVKVYCDAIEMGYRTVESVPEEYRKEVERELNNRAESRVQHLYRKR